MEVHLSRLFSYGFRPLFLCTCAGALFFIGWWIGIVQGFLPPPDSPISALAWHGHEMLFGFVGSAIGGFLLTAVANWTRRPPVQGVALAILLASWLSARVVITYDLGLSAAMVMIIDAGYWILLTLLMGREVLAARNYRNLRIVAILAVFTLLNFIFHFDRVFGFELGSEQAATRATMILVCVLISVIGGRIIPAFTGNWLRMRHGPGTKMPAAFGVVDQAAIGLTIATGLAWTLFPLHLASGLLALLTGIVQLVRMARWMPHLTWPDPLVVVLHVGYAWLGIGLLLLGFSILGAAIPVSSGLHALGVGAMAGLILAVSSRAAMGHTNRPLKAGSMLSIVFLLINLAALARVIASITGTDLLSIAAILWILAFLVFGIRLGPILLGPAKS